MSVCTKFQLPSLSRRGRKVFGSGVVLGGLAVTIMSNLNPSCIELELGLGLDIIEKITQ